MIDLARIGISDMTALCVDPRQSGDLAEWRAMRERRGHSIASEMDREGIPAGVIASRRKGAAARPSKPRAWRPIMEGRNPVEQSATAAIVNARRRVVYDKWQAEVEERDGLFSISGAAKRVLRSRTTVKDAVAAGHIPFVLVDCPPRGHPLQMVKMADVVARFGQP